jgi:hypothetical protein
MEFYDSKANLVSVSSSILRAYGIKPNHPSYAPLDELFQKNDVPHRKVCLVLLDGFGTAIQYYWRKKCPFIYSHRNMKITSVFPPTTVAATTALLTDLYPIENGWMGWTQKFPQYNLPVTMFPSTFIGGEEKTPENTLGLVPIEYIDTKINNLSSYKANHLMGFLLPNPNTDQFILETEKMIHDNNFTYAYWTDPDESLHEFGNKDERVGRVIEDLDKKIEKLVNDCPSTLILTIADHGHIDTKYFSIYEHEDFFSTLRNRSFGLEPRAASFYVKDIKKKEFEKLAHKYYGKYFYIYSAKEVREKKIFGLGKANKYYDEFVGDYLLISKGPYTFSQDTTANFLLSHHAGGTARERYINIGVYNSK